MAAAIARARRSQSLLEFVLPQSSCTYHSCALAGSDSRSRALDSSSARSQELSLWRNYLKGLVSVRTMATFNQNKPHMNIGTIGHVDHGKTTHGSNHQGSALFYSTYDKVKSSSKRRK